MAKLDHSKFHYSKRHLDESGAVRNCVCDDCKMKRIRRFAREFMAKQR